MLGGTTFRLHPDADRGLELATRHMPILMHDRNEPFPLLTVGWRIHPEPALPTADAAAPLGQETVIEFAFWYGWSIQHLFSLERAWVTLDRKGNVARVEATRFGKRFDMSKEGCRLSGGRPVLYVEPGTHAHWPTRESFAAHQARIAATCGIFAGEEWVDWSNEFVAAASLAADPYSRRLVRLRLKCAAFVPSFDFVAAETASVPLVALSELHATIPGQLIEMLDETRRTVPHLKAVLLDCGDTLIDEATEQKVPGSEVVLSADIIPGADTTLHKLKRMGHDLVLVADGPVATFENLLKPRGLWDLFSGHVISETTGYEKPDMHMFTAAFGIVFDDEIDPQLTVMVGNNLERDIPGANRAGCRSVFMKWSTRRSHVPADADQTPDFTISFIDDLPELIDRIDLMIAGAAGLAAARSEHFAYTGA